MNVVVIRTAEGIIVGLDRSMLRLIGQSVWAESKLLVRRSFAWYRNRFAGRAICQKSLICRGGITLGKFSYFSFRHCKFRGATIQTHNKLPGEYPHDLLVNVFQCGKMDCYFPIEIPLVEGPT